MTEVEQEPFVWNAEEALKVLNRGCRIILTQDGLGDITALALPKWKSLDEGLREWADFLPYSETIEDMQREVFAGPNKFSGCGKTVAQALHCLVEKAIFNRLPDGKGGFYTPPADVD
jgi:hypothetical protein